VTINKPPTNGRETSQSLVQFTPLSAIPITCKSTIKYIHVNEVLPSPIQAFKFLPTATNILRYSLSQTALIVGILMGA